MRARNITTSQTDEVYCREDTMALPKEFSYRRQELNVKLKKVPYCIMHPLEQEGK